MKTLTGRIPVSGCLFLTWVRGATGSAMRPQLPGTFGSRGRRLLALAAVSVVAASGACGGQGDDAGSVPTGPEPVVVDERDAVQQWQFRFEVEERLDLPVDVGTQPDWVALLTPHQDGTSASGGTGWHASDARSYGSRPCRRPFKFLTVTL